MNTQLIEDLKATREQLETRGRCTISLVQSSGKVCLDGAIGVATIENFVFLDRDYDDNQKAYRALKSSPRAMAVINAIYEQVKDVRLNSSNALASTVADEATNKGTWSSPDKMRGVWVFNDWTGATDQDCFDVIDKALAAAGGMA